MTATFKVGLIAAITLAGSIAIGPVLAPPQVLIPDPSISPSPSVGPLPPVLQNEWVGSRHPIDRLDIGSAPCSS